MNYNGYGGYNLYGQQPITQNYSPLQQPAPIPQNNQNTQFNVQPAGMVFKN